MYQFKHGHGHLQPLGSTIRAGIQFGGAFRERRRRLHSYLACDLLCCGSHAPLGSLAWVLSARKRAEQEQQALERKLQQKQKLESLGALAGGIAHDFNNLIMRVLGNVALIRMDLASVLPAQSANLLDEHLEQIDAAGQCATDLSRQLLAYAGKSSLALERTSLSQLVVQSLPLIHLAVRGVAKVQLQLMDQLPLIIADVTQLRQVLLNLVINAAEAISPSNVAEAISPSVASVESHASAGTGSVLIATSVVQVTEQQLRSAHAAPDATSGPHAVLQITDDGVGMDSSTLSRIFEPFFTTKVVGRGLGLSVVLGIVHGHHGVLQVVSRPGKGTSFQLMFPLARTP